jgi:hypothetical protein
VIKQREEKLPKILFIILTKQWLQATCQNGDAYCSQNAHRNTGTNVKVSSTHYNKSSFEHGLGKTSFPSCSRHTLFASLSSSGHKFNGKCSNSFLEVSFAVKIAGFDARPP